MSFSCGIIRQLSTLGVLKKNHGLFFLQRKFTTSADRNHYKMFRVPVNNYAIFPDFRFCMSATNLLSGKLYSSPMPRDLASCATTVNDFQEELRVANIDCVFVLTETHEYFKYAGLNINHFYQRKLGLQCYPFSIPDFSVPSALDFTRIVSLVIDRLGNGSNCLVHCAGGKVSNR
mmetsp:Transcript_16630/g.20160  ORF Transcript_16630/g.20160 Transcript_16630/m.20160 type:complete len:175 (-) Transcript_16630:662-1186(-)